MIAMIASTAMTAAGTIAAGNQQRAAGRWQQQESERQSRAERAGAQREAEQIERRRDLASARLQTSAAASGFSATDPTALLINDEIQRYGTYQARMSQYGGEDRATGLEAQGAMARFSGDAAASGSRLRAVSTVLDGISGLNRYRNTGGRGGSGGGNNNYLGWG
jgi:hypothetical protein